MNTVQKKIEAWFSTHMLEIYNDLFQVFFPTLHKNKTYRTIHRNKQVS